MRWFYLVSLLVVVAIIVVFVVQNNDRATVNLFNQSLTAPLSWFFVAVYFLGMWSGATVVAFFKWAYHHATENAQKRAS